ncbi:hypothetical protein BC628DRAFT_1067771 [Trametes gibbosa]|nr:hypothetical protein BC628DRAFT_1067771 [Trametes gibbosa]
MQMGYGQARSTFCSTNGMFIATIFSCIHYCSSTYRNATAVQGDCGAMQTVTYRIVVHLTDFHPCASQVHTIYTRTPRENVIEETLQMREMRGFRKESELACAARLSLRVWESQGASYLSNRNGNVDGRSDVDASSSALSSPSILSRCRSSSLVTGH